ncbi:hypothetical protein GCK72_025966 [Caenorhabditis remanei]|uniref:Phlebovirus glycoprotein G2 fusion domain-containing protein n=1 Tax=Caenorhabditis remanei TaxID=31234 RepID=A0A6A5G3D2_CAERE|nr:hypothetical protein GCK72_025966 [Caenorhabditis remanei]KAF1749498.1 hypothetical protein GCK72_025966 [Caenorhabditis remanei]
MSLSPILDLMIRRWMVLVDVYENEQERMAGRIQSREEQREHGPRSHLSAGDLFFVNRSPIRFPMELSDSRKTQQRPQNRVPEPTTIHNSTRLLNNDDSTKGMDKGITIYAKPRSSDKMEIFRCMEYNPVARIQVVSTSLNSYKKFAKTEEIKVQTGKVASLKDCSFSRQSNDMGLSKSDESL